MSSNEDLLGTESKELTVEEYLAEQYSMRSSGNETQQKMGDLPDKTIEEYLKENQLASHEDHVVENGEHTDLTVEEYLDQIKATSPDNHAEEGLGNNLDTLGKEAECTDVSVEDYLKQMEQVNEEEEAAAINERFVFQKCISQVNSRR